MDAPNDATTTVSGGNISTALSEGLTASETVKTEKNVKLTPRHNRQHNDAKVHFSGLLVRYASEVASDDFLVSELAVWVSYMWNRA